MQTLAKAAEELHLTQPAVSIQIRNFQQQFDIPLTEVAGRRIYITDFGKELAQSTEETFFRSNKLQNSVSQRSINWPVKIVNGIQRYICDTFVLSPFMKQHKSLELIVDVTNRGKAIESLEQNTVDFSLISILPGAPAVEKLDLLENRLFLVGNGKEKFKKTLYSKHILKELPLIFREKRSGTRQVMENFLERNELDIIKKNGACVK